MNIIEKFNQEENIFQKDAVEYALLHYEEVKEQLLEEMRYFASHMEKWKEEAYPMSVLYCLNILAQKREKELFPILIDIFSQKDFDFFEELGDAFTDYIQNRIVSVFNGDFQKMNQLIENKEVDSMGRTSFLLCYTYFADHNMISKNELIEYLKHLIKYYEYQKEEEDIYTSIVTVVMESHLYDLRDEVKELYRLDLINLHMFGKYDNFIDDLFDVDDTYKETYHPIEDTIKEMSRWACFDNSDKEFNEKKFLDKLQSFQKNMDNKYLNKQLSSKIGRNDPCPCGSGKKYKKCCIDKPIKKFLEYQGYIDEDVNRYPKKKKKETQKDLYDFWKEDYIEIDKILHKVFIHKSIPRWIKRDYETENLQNLEDLSLAFQKIKKIIQEENIKSALEYNQKVSIHYDIEDFIERYSELLTKMNRSSRELTSFFKSVWS